MIYDRVTCDRVIGDVMTDVMNLRREQKGRCVNVAAA